MYIVFEGIDGSGKSTLINFLFNWLNSRGYRVFVHKEPSKSKIGELIRRCINENADAYTLALLFAADRYHRINDLKEKISKGIVLADRCFYSSIAYQGVYVDKMWIREINKFAVKPDYVIYLDVSPEVAVKRKKHEKKDLFENVEYLKKVRENYLRLAEEENFVVINAEQSLDVVKKSVLNFVIRIIKERT